MWCEEPRVSSCWPSFISVYLEVTELTHLHVRYYHTKPVILNILLVRYFKCLETNISQE